MALPKLVKRGGAYYQGYALAVSSAVGDYILTMTQTAACMINSVSVVADKYGTNDAYSLSHLTSGTTRTIAVLASSIYNPGANISTMFDFPAYESMVPGEALRLTYTNVATVALNVHVIVEYVGITKTS